MNEKYYKKRRDQLTMVYFDNLDNGSLKKYKKNLKNKKKI
jgi:predicted CopG family antitoxin